jgi:hypothetical protein
MILLHILSAGVVGESNILTPNDAAVREGMEEINAVREFHSLKLRSDF